MKGNEFNAPLAAFIAVPERRPKQGRELKNKDWIQVKLGNLVSIAQVLVEKIKYANLEIGDVIKFKLPKKKTLDHLWVKSKKSDELEIMFPKFDNEQYTYDWSDLEDPTVTKSYKIGLESPSPNLNKKYTL